MPVISSFDGAFFRKIEYNLSSSVLSKEEVEVCSSLLGVIFVKSFSNKSLQEEIVCIYNFFKKSVVIGSLYKRRLLKKDVKFWFNLFSSIPHFECKEYWLKLFFCSVIFKSASAIISARLFFSSEWTP